MLEFILELNLKPKTFVILDETLVMSFKGEGIWKVELQMTDLSLVYTL